MDCLRMSLFLRFAGKAAGDLVLILVGLYITIQ
ncbi:hypothetical protein KYC_15372 [Achromobacter arsenitoxydans SY8]|uniref:Uncharacterized protein n=1 Tax=Achromobacter arsenitoxydans SY8 TaxID=477184 RepID=H0F8H6_9BURK|nr:hypothetical protein KYC_15372 [Achromobacter arsenitoxydans SY8]